MVVAPLNDLLENSLVDLGNSVTCGSKKRSENTDIRNRNGFARVAEILKHILNQDRAFSDSAL